MAERRTVVVAQIGAAHGIKGEVRLKPFTDVPGDVAAYGPLTAPDGRVFEIVSVRPAAGSSPGMLVARLKGIEDRNAAEALNGLELSVPQERLPAPAEDEYYHADLIGLDAVSEDGTFLGTIVAVPNYGAGDLLEIAPKRGESLLIPFTAAFVPRVDVKAGRVVVVPPTFVGDDEDAAS